MIVRYGVTHIIHLAALVRVADSSVIPIHAAC